MITDYVKIYDSVVPKELAQEIMETEVDYQSSEYAGHVRLEKEHKSTEQRKLRVNMDDFWIRKDHKWYEPVKKCFSRVLFQYSKEPLWTPRFEYQHTTDFRINKYGEGCYMREHTDNIHHSHGQQWGFPQVSILLILNDGFEGGDFCVTGKKYEIPACSGIIFPSNFMFPHEVKEIKKGCRWSIVSWIM
jgi:hypothetical protein